MTNAEGPSIVILKEEAVRFGTYRINECKDSPPRLSLRFSSGELNFYTCSLQYIEGRS